MVTLLINLLQAGKELDMKFFIEMHYIALYIAKVHVLLLQVFMCYHRTPFIGILYDRTR